MQSFKHLDSKQRLRLQRLFMAIGTYIVVIFATFLTTRLGLGKMNTTQWLIFIGLGICINLLVYTLIYTGKNLNFSDPSLTREQIMLSAVWGMVPLYSLPDARPIVLLFYIPAFSFGLLRLSRRQYFIVVAGNMGIYGTLLIVEFVQNRPGFNVQYELFLFCLFGILMTWFAFFGGFVHAIRENLRLQTNKIQKAHHDLTVEIEERKLAQIEKDNLIVELQEALNTVKTLSGLLPICASCKNIRDDKGYWNRIESYIRSHSEAEFTHSICPDCYEKYYSDYKDGNDGK